MLSAGNIGQPARPGAATALCATSSAATAASRAPRRAPRARSVTGRLADEAQLGRAREQRGHGDAEALRIVDPDVAQRLDDLRVLDRFGDRQLAHQVADAVDR